MQGRSRKPKSEYGQQLEIKQELKETYGLREGQLARYFRRGKTPDKIIRDLESRLDNVVYRSGFAATRRSARQLVSHGHIKINGRNVNLASYGVKVKDTISIHPSSVNIVPIKDLAMTLNKFEAPAWIALDKKNLTATIIANPSIEEPVISSSIKPVIEFYSR